MVPEGKTDTGERERIRKMPKENSLTSIRPLTAEDRQAWQPLWAGYLAFYHSTSSEEQTELTWNRFLDAREPMHAMGAFLDGELRGIVHYIFHRSCWTAGPYCYLQDLYVAEECRGMGLGRSLIEAVYTAAEAAGASRVHWLTHETNLRAMQLYDKIADRPGFVQYRHNL